ncbi:histidine kinase dimerization/phosphoacceptor domain -containing protein [uncultured Enterovirga sp.]|uniref:histidine kinase dimerization/phosphoacceptor domain -containing protein n=1 Tax=uncultured Enterovirga sp. TaxID=2026352 RepID=UPI0035CBAB82
MESSDSWKLTGNLPHELGRGDPFAAALRATRMAMIITDPRQDDNPIVFANDAFLRLTGYGREEVMGRNCRFLQGPETDRAAIGHVRDAIQSDQDISIDLLNYRKDGSFFWNALYLSPVRSSGGETQFFFASQLDVTDRIELRDRLASENARIEAEVKRRTRDLEEALAAKNVLLHEVDHRVKNNLQMIASLIALQARRIPDEQIRRTLKSMLGRVEALGTVHRRLYQSDDVSRFDVAEFTRDVANDLVAASGREDICLDLRLVPVEVPAAKAAPLALMVNELVTNAIKHAFPDRGGRIRIEVEPRGDRFFIKMEDDGIGTPPEVSRRTSLGRTLIENFALQLQADVVSSSADPGTRIEIAIPIDRVQNGT